MSSLGVLTAFARLLMPSRIRTKTTPVYMCLPPGAADASLLSHEDGALLDDLQELKDVQHGAICEGSVFAELAGFNHTADVVWASDTQTASMEDAVSYRLNEYAEVHDTIKFQMSSAVEHEHGTDDPIMDELNIDAKHARKKGKEASSLLACASIAQQVDLYSSTRCSSRFIV